MKVVLQGAVHKVPCHLGGAGNKLRCERCSLFQHVPKDLICLFCPSPPRVGVLSFFPSCLPHLFCSVRIRDNTINRFSECSAVFRRNKVTINPVANYFWNSSSSRSNDRQSASHRFTKRHSKAFCIVFSMNGNERTR